MGIVVASTCASYKCKDGDELGWLRCAEEMMEITPGDLTFFCAVQVGQGHDQKFEALKARMGAISGTIWTFSFDDGETGITGWKRINDICMGRNLGIEYALRTEASHVLFLDTDVYVESNCLQRLLEIDHPLVGGNIGSYCLGGPQVLDEAIPDGADVREHWTSAGFLLVQREAFRVLRWRHDFDIGLTDDPAFAADAEARGFGKTWVRHDVLGRHDQLMPVDRRGYDLSINPS